VKKIEPEIVLDPGAYKATRSIVAPLAGQLHESVELPMSTIFPPLAKVHELPFAIGK
jgi:hypothetical protein